MISILYNERIFKFNEKSYIVGVSYYDNEDGNLNSCVLIERKMANYEEREIIAHGLNAGFQMLLNIVTTIILGTLFGLAIESLFFLVSFSFIRTYAGGYHCQKVTNCYLVSSGMVIMVLAIIKFIASDYMLLTSIAMLLISVPVIFKLAPIETPTKLLDELEQTYFRKKTLINLSLECTLFVILSFFKLHNFGYIISLGILMSALLVLLGNKQNDYKN